MNPNNDAYWESRGYDERPDDWESLSDSTPSYDDNRANQLNPNNDAYWQSRGYDERPDDWDSIDDSTSSYDDNRANQLNPNNDAYWQSRGYDERPNYVDDADEDTTTELNEKEATDSVFKKSGVSEYFQNMDRKKKKKLFKYSAFAVIALIYTIAKSKNSSEEA